MEHAVCNNAQIQLLGFCISFMPATLAGSMPSLKNRETPHYGVVVSAGVNLLWVSITQNRQEVSQFDLLDEVNGLSDLAKRLFAWWEYGTE